jgi:hypothetical protein
MLEYTKTVLKKVSFDKELFSRELEKSIKWLKACEIEKLKQWLVENYYHMYKDIILNIFSNYKVEVA